MLKISAIAFSLLTFSSTAFCKTKMSNLVEKVQTKYADKFKEHPILIMDKDDINWRISQEKAFGEKGEKRRIKIIIKYVKEKTGVDIEHNDAINLDTYISILKNSAVAVPLTTNSWSKVEYKICTVFHADPNSNQRLESERLLGLQTGDAYKEYKYEHLVNKLGFEQLQLFSIYHELGHCLDTKYLVAAQTAYDDPHGIHQSESFAETAGLLLLTREGHKDLAGNRINMRSIYSRQFGQYLVDTPQMGFGNPNAKYGGIIYHMAPVLEASDKLIKEQRTQIEESTVSEILELSENIVENHALDSRTFHGISLFMENGKEETLVMYRNYEQSFPDLFVGVIDNIIEYIEGTQQIINNSFDTTRVDIPFRNTLRPLSVEKDFCPAYLSEDRDSFDQQLDVYREDLRLENGTPEEQRERQADLMNIHEAVAATCD